MKRFGFALALLMSAGSQQASAASFLDNFQVTMTTTCGNPGFQKITSTLINRIGKEIFLRTEKSDKTGAHWVANQSISRKVLGNAPVKNGAGTNTSEITETTAVLRQDVPDFWLTIRINKTGPSTCEAVQETSAGSTCTYSNCTIQ